jgi:hypothetical protein
MPLSRFPVRKAPQIPPSQNLEEQSVSVLQGTGVRAVLLAGSGHAMARHGGQGALDGRALR